MTGSCPSGQAIRAIHVDGTVLCGSVGGGGLSGYEMVFTTVTLDASRQVIAQCPTGKNVLGGGGQADIGTLEKSVPEPSDGPTRWRCVFAFAGFAPATCYAICADVD